MGNYSEAFIGIDTAKLRNAVAVAEAGRRGEIRYLGEIDTSEVATRKLVAGLAAMRELTRARDAAKQDLTRKRQQVSSMLLRLGLHYPGIETWNARHRSWLAHLKLEHSEQRFVLEEMLQAERQAGERVARLEQAIREAVPDWSLAAIVPALMAMRGIDLVSAVTILDHDDFGLNQSKIMNSDLFQ